MDRQVARSNVGRDNEDAEVVHFFTILSQSFRSQLVFPDKFVKNCLSKVLSNISSTVSLRGPSGRTWTAELMWYGSEDDEILYLGKGWEIFVKDHDLKENDVLFLEYKLGGSVFDVLVLDNENFCEKESSYFVRNCKNVGCQRSNGFKERNRVEREPCIETIEPMSLCYKKKRIAIGNDEVEDSGSETSPLPGHKKGNAPASVKRDEEEEDNQGNTMAPVLRKGPPKEKGTAFQQAVREGIRWGMPHLVIVMKPTHVASIFAMTVPLKFSSNYIPLGTKFVSLKVNGKTWFVEYVSFGISSSSGFRGLGWRDFVRSNKLKVGDVCLFETTSSSSSKMARKSIILNVSIFRI